MPNNVDRLARLKYGIKKISREQFVRYSLVSGVALVIDYLMYFIIINNRFLSLPIAAAVGYCTGLSIAYVLMKGRVFSGGWLSDNKGFEALLFGLSGILGVAITYISVLVYETYIGNSVIFSKILASLISFILVFLFRRFIVFRSGISLRSG